MLRTPGTIPLILIVATLSGCGPTWTNLERREVGFSVAMPSAAGCNSRIRLQTSQGRITGGECNAEVALWPEWWWRLSTGYSVSWLDLPPGLTEAERSAFLKEVAILEDLEQGVPPPHEPDPVLRSPVLARMQWTPEERAMYHIDFTKHPAALGGEDGSEYVSLPRKDETNDTGFPPFRVRCRVCLHGSRLYRVSVYGVISRARERDWDRMLESFKFLPETATH